MLFGESFQTFAFKRRYRELDQVSTLQPRRDSLLTTDRLHSKQNCNDYLNLDPECNYQGFYKIKHCGHPETFDPDLNRMLLKRYEKDTYSFGK